MASVSQKLSQQQLQQQLDSLPGSVRLVTVTVAPVSSDIGATETDELLSQRLSHLSVSSSGVGSRGRYHSRAYNQNQTDSYQVRMTSAADFDPHDKLRMHVGFNNPHFGHGAGCKPASFTKSRLPIPYDLEGWCLITIDGKSSGKKIDQALKVVYLARDDWDKHHHSEPDGSDGSDSLRGIVTDKRLIPVEINVCPCVVEATGVLPAGTLILGKQQYLEDVIEQRLPFHPDTLEELVVVSVADLLADSSYCGYMLKQVLPYLKKYHHLYLVSAVDPSHHNELVISAGKRHPFESSEDCAVRELREEFSLQAIDLYSHRQAPIVAGGVKFFFTTCDW